MPVALTLTRPTKPEKVGRVRLSRHPAKSLRLRLHPVSQRIQRCAFCCHIHKRLSAVLRLNIYPRQPSVMTFTV